MENQRRLTVSSDFGKLLRRLRLAAGLSQEALAERARMSTNGIGTLERGYHHAPRHETVTLLATALMLDGEQRREFEESARLGTARRLLRNSSADPWRDSQTSNLPRSLTSFVGRERDVFEVKELLEIHRLITLTGSGGVGKTRLAIEVGEELLDRYPDGVWFVDLAPINDPELVTSVAGQAVGVSQQRERPLCEAIPQLVKTKRLLIVFDNCEHVLEPTASLAKAILATAQHVRILATSRQRFDIKGEVIYRIPSLAVPGNGVGLKAADVSHYGAVALFVDRAIAADAHFVLTDNNAPIVAEICRRLDGIPLAIELAAARVTVLSIPHLAKRLNERSQILTRGSRTALPRQQTLTALIDWSYDLLTQEQLLFERLGIFVGGFDADAVAAVCCDNDLEEPDILELLASLIDKSLLVDEISGELARFRLLESTATYSFGRLSASGDLERLRRRHAEYFREQAEAARDRYGAGSTIAWLAGEEPELDNYRAALEWTLTRGNDPVAGGAIASALVSLWWLAGLMVEGCYWVELALPRVSEATHPMIAGRLHAVLSSFHVGKRAYEAAGRAVLLCKAGSDPRVVARAMDMRGYALLQMGGLDEARAATSQAIEALRACGDTWMMAHALWHLATIEMSIGDFQQARELLTQSLSVWSAIGDEVGIAAAAGSLAELEFVTGDFDEVLRFSRQALEFAMLGKNPNLTANWHNNSAAYHVALGDLAGARESAGEGLRIARRLQREQFVVVAIQNFALLAVREGDPRCSARLLGYVEARYSQLGIRRRRVEQWAYNKLLAELRAALSLSEIERLGAEGAVWSEDNAVEQALQV